MKPIYHNSKNNFFNEMRNDVYNSLGKNFKKKADKIILAKGIILFLLFFIPLASYWIYSNNSVLFITCAMLLGVLCLPLVLNIGHESVHNNFTENKKVNSIGKNIFYLLGTSPYFWELRHISSHHTYSNIKDWDLDIEQSNLIRLSNTQEHKPHHKLQHFYIPFLFLFYTLIWFFVRDFRDLKNKKFGAKTISKHPVEKIILLFAAKVWHFSILLIIPYLISKNLDLAIVGFFVFHFSASLTTTFALISTHIGEDQKIISIDERNTLPYSWVEHQLKTTADFSTESALMLHFFGGFNHHVAHHLFPNIPHVLYPKVTTIIKKHCDANNVKYHCYSNLLECAKSHLKRLKNHSLIIND